MQIYDSALLTALLINVQRLKMHLFMCMLLATTVPPLNTKLKMKKVPTRGCLSLSTF